MAAKRVRVAEAMAARPLETLVARVPDRPPATAFRDRLRDGELAFVCEVKRGSPSRGLFAPDLDPVALARAYEAGGASAVSVITEVDHFFAEPDVLARVRGATSLPVLKKDFFFDPYQLYEARLEGADLALSIAACLEDAELATLLACARGIGLEVIVEVHDADELDRAVALGAGIIGINNRDLRDFSVDLSTTERLRPRVPADRAVVGESGILTPDDVVRLRDAGVHGVLIGESLAVSPDPEALLRAMRAAVTGNPS